MTPFKFLIPACIALAFTACKSDNNKLSKIESKIQSVDTVQPAEEFEHVSEQFADLRVLRYNVKGFDKLPAQTKELLYYLYEAALCGRDITWDQNYKYNLTVRKTLENIISHPNEHQSDAQFKSFMTYAKRVFFSSGIHHHYSSDKFIPECSQEFFREMLHHADSTTLPKLAGQTADQFADFIINNLNDKIAGHKV